HAPFPSSRKGSRAIQTRGQPRSRLRRRSAHFRVHKLPNLRLLFVDLRQVPRADLLINLELLLSPILLAGVNVGLAEAVVRVREIGIVFESLQIFRNGLGILALVRVEIPQLQMRLGEVRIEGERLSEQRLDLMNLDLMKLEARILRPLSFPQTHRVIEERTRVLRLQLGKTAKSFDDLVGVDWRTVKRPRKEKITTRVRRI